jgi:hypothetical protein
MWHEESLMVLAPDAPGWIEQMAYWYICTGNDGRVHVDPVRKYNYRPRWKAAWEAAGRNAAWHNEECRCDDILPWFRAPWRKWRIL